MLNIVGFAVAGSCPKVPDNCISNQLPLFKQDVWAPQIRLRLHNFSKLRFRIRDAEFAGEKFGKEGVAELCNLFDILRDG